MDFFDRQQKTRNRSWLFLALFCLSILSFVVLVYMGAMLYLSRRGDFTIWHNPTSFIVILGAIGPIVFQSLMRIHQIKSEGAQAIIERMDVRYIESFSECPLERRLKNVVEEMAIASNQPRPEIYVLNEFRINALTVALTKEDVCIGVTQGALENLTRSELQALVANQFAQIINGDVQFKTNMIGWLHGISFIQRSGEKLMEAEGRAIVIGFVLNVVGYLGYLQSLFIKRFFCWQRQYLADAYAVQYTRDPECLGGTLKKVKNNSSIAMLVNDEVAHLFFTDPCPLKIGMHPCEEDRLDAIYEGRPGRHEDPKYPATSSKHHQATAKKASPNSASFIPSSTALLSGLSEAMPTHYSFPMDIRPMEITADSAKAALLAVLECSQDYGAVNNKLVTDFASAYQACEPTRKLRLIDQAATIVAKQPKAERAQLEKRIHQLIHSDGKIDLFEFMVLMVLKRRIRASSSTQKEAEYGIGELVWETQLLVSAVAISGSTEEQAELAFQQGARDLEFEIGSYIERLPTDQCHWANIEKAITQFTNGSDAAKSILIRGLQATAKADNKIEDNELYIIQAICAAIDMPMPELISTYQVAK